MSLAPASSRGAFLKARLAVNGIQCAAKSFGTLTAGGCGLLSNMAASSSVIGGSDIIQNYQLRGHPGTSITCDISAYLNELLRRQPNSNMRTLESKDRRFQASLSCSIGRFEGGHGDVQRVVEAARGVGHFDLAVQLLAKRFDHPGSEASPGRRVDRRAAFFGPGQTQPFSLFVDGPGSGGHRQRAKFG